tara:strand:- start:251 stop:646 length:396 start_codon:yes stop_codon:yes gene_type:complete
MKFSKTKVDKIIKEEVKLFLEACGCGAPDSEVIDTLSTPLQGVATDYEVHDVDHSDDDIGELSKEDALELVSMIARKTSCPVTRDALSDVVSNLGGFAGEDSMFDLMPHDEDEMDWSSGNVIMSANPEEEG